MFYGETILADALCEALGLGLLDPVADEGWLPNLPHRYRLREIELSTFGEACGLDRPRFVKPTDEKFFPARVYPAGALREHTSVDSSAPALVAEPVEFEVEFRAFVLERSIATMSPYIRGGDLARRDGEWFAEDAEWEGAKACLEALLTDTAVDLPPAVVVDVGLIRGRGWAVVEANPAWGSGLCGCDPVPILQVLKRASVRTDSASVEDQRWLRKSQLCIER